MLKEFVPASWFHPVGVHKVLKRFWHRLPDVSGKLFLTFTVDPKLFRDEESAFTHSRDRLRRVFHRLRGGAEHEGKVHVIDAPYCIKVEFHESGWVHYHAVFLTRRFVPVELLKELWGLGRVHIARIKTEDFEYLLKYVTKPDDMPEWVKQRKRLRMFQTSRGFLKPEGAKPEKPASDPRRESIRRATSTLGERWERWQRQGTLIDGKRVRTIRFLCRFRELFDHLVLSVAREGRYLGNGLIKLSRKGGVMEWLRMQQVLMAARC
ncbi:MAG: hypothetical protein H7A46_12425 [Verrucomicrobiales bacterium]|nr:hypothetical protein [Verrucomicrobiales bacterium]